MLLALVVAAAGLGLTVSAVRKATNYRNFARAVAAYDPRFAQATPVAWIAAEAGAGVGLVLLPNELRAVPVSWLLAAATGAVAKRVRQGEVHDCGCHSKPRPIGPRALVGNSMLIAGAVTISGSLGGSGAAAASLSGAAAAFAMAYMSVGTPAAPQEGEDEDRAGAAASLVSPLASAGRVTGEGATEARPFRGTHP